MAVITLQRANALRRLLSGVFKLTAKQRLKILRKMTTVVSKQVETVARTDRGADVTVKGSRGMTTLKIKATEFMLYTSEVKTLIEALTEFQQTLIKEGITNDVVAEQQRQQSAKL